jgi:uncharacterized SAM-binding protein YcdF (DUF218 family)
VRLAYLLHFACSIGGLLSLLIVLGVMALVRPRSRAIVRALLCVVVGYTAMSTYPIPHTVNEVWSRPFSPLTKAVVPPGKTAIVILGSGSVTAADWNDRRAAVPDPIGLSRTLEAVRVLALAGAEWVISSGGPPGPTSINVSAADAMRDELLRQGVPASRIITRGESRDTYEEALTMAKLLPTLQVDHVVLVTSPVHMRRAAATFRKAGMAVIPAPAREDLTGRRLGWQLKYLPSERGLYETALVAHEILGFVYYRLRGWR